MLRTLVTKADEALAVVIFENNFEEWDMLARGLEVHKNKRLTRYTHRVDETGGAKKGWSLKGKEQYNEMFDTIERLRRINPSGDKL